MTEIGNFGMIVIGPGGSGKSTFCKEISSFYTSINRQNIIVNMDPGNENPEYKTLIDINELIKIEDVQNDLNLGKY